MIQREYTKDEILRARLSFYAADLHEALKTVLQRYLAATEKCNCRYYNPDKEDAVIAARAVLAKIEGTE